MEGQDRRKRPLHVRIMLGLLAGVVAGLLASLLLGPEDARLEWAVANVTAPLGNVWLRLLLMVVMPLVFSALVVGVAGMGDVRRLGRVGLRTLGYTIGISAVSVLIGLVLVNVVRPGERIDPSTAAALEAEYGRSAGEQVGATTAALEQKKAKPVALITEVVDRLVPQNPVSAMVGTPNLLHIMFFALVLGIAATQVPPATAKPFLGFFEALYEITVRIINAIMVLAPWAVALLVFSSVASFGSDLLVALLWYVGTVLGGLLIHGFLVYGLSVRFLSGLRPMEFFGRVRTVAVTAFSTSSSNATLPTALRETHEKLGVPQEINSFVLTIGATANQNGTALYEGVTILFLAQLAGADLGLSMQLTVTYLAILGGIGTAGVPGGSIPYIIVVLASLGVDPALIAIILGVDRILDMCRTAVNVVGDITAATYVAKSEGHTLLGAVGKG